MNGQSFDVNGIYLTLADATECVKEMDIRKSKFFCPRFSDFHIPEVRLIQPHICHLKTVQLKPESRSRLVHFPSNRFLQSAFCHWHKQKHQHAHR